MANEQWFYSREEYLAAVKASGLEIVEDRGEDLATDVLGYTYGMGKQGEEGFDDEGQYIGTLFENSGDYDIWYDMGAPMGTPTSSGPDSEDLHDWHGKNPKAAALEQEDVQAAQVEAEDKRLRREQHWEKLRGVAATVNNMFAQNVAQATVAIADTDVVWATFLHQEICHMPAKSFVGACIVGMCNKTNELLALIAKDGLEDETRAMIIGAVVQQAEVWYYG